MTPKIYINGKYFDKQDAKVSVYDHGLLYGDGVFEGIRVYSGRVFRHREHIERLYESARAIKLDIPLNREQMRQRGIRSGGLALAAHALGLANEALGVLHHHRTQPLAGRGQGVEVDDDAIVAGAAAGDVVRAAADRQRQAVVAREVDGGNDIRRRAAPDTGTRRRP